jgi:hypothetical protein
MNLYLLEQSANNNYDTYDSVIVAAQNEDEARKIHPSSYEKEGLEKPWYKRGDRFSTWAYELDQVNVSFIGVAKEGTEKGVILASFNAG